MNIDDATTFESAAGDAGIFRFSLAHSMVRQRAWVVAVVVVAVLIVAVVVPVVLIAVGVGLALWAGIPLLTGMEYGPSRGDHTHLGRTL
ncbi:hypothetical protein ACHIPZ_21270 [Antrihabitans sp. NCIMB 15449]|uniref:DUF3040 domain-containing protein n=1 Tax=Antrihabitans spumae TaxID=3373370 RepID=A0ABW7JRS4_9NOCA